MKNTNWVLCLILILGLPAWGHDKQQVEAEARLAAARHNLDPDLYVAIIRVESNLYQGAYNAKTADYGAAQVNRGTAKLYGFSLSRLKSDLKYNLEAGAIILADMRKSYPNTYVGRYNVGTGALVGRRLQIYLKYRAKVFKEYADIVKSKSKGE